MLSCLRNIHIAFVPGLAFRLYLWLSRKQVCFPLTVFDEYSWNYAVDKRVSCLLNSFLLAVEARKLQSLASCFRAGVGKLRSANTSSKLLKKLINVEERDWVNFSH